MCNERFLFRFGLDRVLILLGKHLKQLGHTVYGMANRYDHEIVETVFSRVINVPIGTDNYLNLNEFTATWLKSTWNQHFDSRSMPDIVLVGGWPFFSAIPFFRKVGTKVVFIDCGAVPLEGYSGSALAIQQKVRSLRARYLKESSLIVAISDFVANSQSRTDSKGTVPVCSVLLGADHMQASVWSAPRLRRGAAQGSAVSIVNLLKRQGRKTILCLGRWEPNCYKNSEAAFDFLRNVANPFPNCALLILDGPSRVNVPAVFRNSVFPIEFPDDRELIEVMKQVDLGISLSLWEGFNLPLAEMQWLNRPVLAFNLAAHPEVVLHPWYLCKDVTEMTEKACEILRGQGLDGETRERAVEKFRRHFRWSRVVQNYSDIFAGLIQNGVSGRDVEKMENSQGMTLIVDVTNSARDPANSGVIRVTRRLCRALQRYANILFVVWDQEANSYVLPTEAEHQQLSQFNGPVLIDKNRLSPDNHRVSLTQLQEFLRHDSTWLVLTETVLETRASHIRRFARACGVQIAAIFYDAIPVLHPEFCNEEVKRNHRQYMRGLAECDVVVPISNFSARCLRDFWDSEKVRGCPVFPNELPGEFGGFERNTRIPTSTSQEVKILCVSTLEPRKNHLRLIQACLLLQEKFPELNWSLTLAGNRYAGAFEIADSIEAIAANNPRIKWLGVVDDVTLHRLYQEASFTVYPSIIEGFGMPILESIWHGRPCICSRDGAPGELAASGGCLTTNVTDEQELSEAIYRMATDKGLLFKLSQEAILREIKTWDAYAREFRSILKSRDTLRSHYHLSGKRALSVTPSEEAPVWQDILYPNCLHDNWQMYDSERLALTALLACHRPRCAIEVGTFQGGSLSLLSQYSEMVFSIDIDPSIPEKFQQFKNVSFLTGPSSVVLALLLKELDDAEIAVDFILIDGDHSPEGVKRDITSLLSYVPQKPLFVMLHDSYNPGCRQGMLEADWARSPYVAWVDIDFIPGRIVEHDGPFHGELWGGLALAYFSPVPREHVFQISCSAETMFRVMSEYTNRNK